MPTSSAAPVQRAAGALPWRRRRGRLEVALVHRPEYDDWAWAKGKLDPGEDAAQAAVREVAEETGLRVRLGRPLPDSLYDFVDRDGHPARKHVRYWAAEVVGGDGRLLHEVDEVAWLGVSEARARLDYTRDVDQLEALAEHDAAGTLTTWPLVVVRHAHAHPRSSWDGDDTQRPLDGKGHRRAQALSPVLDAFGVTRLVSSTSTRCVQTLEPFAQAAAIELRTKGSLTEEAFAVEPERALRRLHKIVDRGVATAVCTHGPLIPTLLDALRHHLDDDQAAGAAMAAMASLVDKAAERSMVKGEAFVCHLVGQGRAARIIAVERHLPDAIVESSSDRAPEAGRPDGE